MNIEYKTINGYEDYQISNTGIVKRVPCVWLNKNSEKLFLKEKILSFGLTKKGSYVTRWVRLKNQNGYRKFYVHQLVAKHFVENPLCKKEVNHIDSNPINNVSTNLEWVTHSENMLHSKNSGRIRKGENSGMSKLKDSDVLYILNSKLHYKELSKRYGVSGRTIHSIKSGQAWKHITKNNDKRSKK